MQPFFPSNRNHANVKSRPVNLELVHKALSSKSTSVSPEESCVWMPVLLVLTNFGI